MEKMEIFKDDINRIMEDNQKIIKNLQRQLSEKRDPPFTFACGSHHERYSTSSHTLSRTASFSMILLTLKDQDWI